MGSEGEVTGNAGEEMWPPLADCDGIGNEEAACLGNAEFLGLAVVGETVGIGCNEEESVAVEE
ncbi:MAG: hypothetical protein DSY42_09155 [Aquifex sp.]|nr:MAG: hypothetical protein DSY42_09155 [Aquifex sp.]